METIDVGVNRLYRHADGGLYRTLGFLEIKMDNGEWKEGVRYMDIAKGEKECGTTIERFMERFVPEFKDRDHEIHE